MQDNPNVQQPKDELSPEEAAAQKLRESQEAYEKLTKKGSKTNGWMSILLLAVNIIVVAIIAIIEFGGNKETVPYQEVFATWGKNFKYIIGIVCLVLVYYLTDILRNAVLIKFSTGSFHFPVSIKSSIMCKYYDNITPLGSGGQPFQMYYMAKHLPVGVATSLPIVVLFLSQLTFFIICMVNFALFPGVVSSYIKAAAYFGACMYIFVPLSVILFSFLPKVMGGVLSFILKIGMRFHLVKDYDTAYEKYFHHVKEYRAAFMKLGKNPLSVVITMLLSAIHYYALMSVPYLVIRASGEIVDYYTITVMTIYIYAAITFIPTPGNSGAAESLFYAIFKVLEGGYLFWGMIMWRFAVYYIFIIVGLITFSIDYITKYRRIARLSQELSEARRTHEELTRESDTEANQVKKE